MKSNEISINGHKRREKIKFDKGLSIRQPVLKRDIQICQTVNCVI